MKCPVCESVALNEREHDQKVETHFCDACHGNWVKGHDLYQLRGGEQTPSTKHIASPYLIDTPRVLFCPSDGNIMVKYRVGVSDDFYFDRCPHCAGVWLDRHEWEVMRSRGLRRELERIFSGSWLNEQVVHEQVIEATYRRETILQTLLNDDEYTEISRLRNWLDVHPNRKDVLSVLLSGRRDVQETVPECPVENKLF